jgi:hypothetical protein
MPLLPKSSPKPTDPASRVAFWIGLLIFFLGVAMVVAVFKLAFDLYGAPPPKIASAVKIAPENQLPAMATAIATDLSGFLKQLLLLLIMCLVGSAIAALGVRLLRR